MTEDEKRVAELIEILKQGLDEYILTWENDKSCLIDNYVDLERLAKFILERREKFQ